MTNHIPSMVARPSLPRHGAAPSSQVGLDLPLQSKASGPASRVGGDPAVRAARRHLLLPPEPAAAGRVVMTRWMRSLCDRPRRIAFRRVRGPVPYITEEFALTEHDGTTRLDYSGELGTDFGIVGQWWAGRVAAAWEAAVRSSLAGIQAESQRRARTTAAG